MVIVKGSPDLVSWFLQKITNDKASLYPPHRDLFFRFIKKKLIFPDAVEVWRQQLSQPINALQRIPIIQCLSIP